MRRALGALFDKVDRKFLVVVTVRAGSLLRGSGGARFVNRVGFIGVVRIHANRGMGI